MKKLFSIAALALAALSAPVFAQTAALDAFGQFATATVPTASAVSLTTATPANVTSITLPPGDWDVAYQVRHKPAASTSITVLSCSLSTTSATMGTQPVSGVIGSDSVTLLTQAAQVNAGEITQASVPVQVSLTASTQIFVVCNDTFTVSTMGAYGTLRARRTK